MYLINNALAIVVVGDENGVVGHGLGKSKDVSSAIGLKYLV
jgi:ribosomal protein S5